MGRGRRRANHGDDGGIVGGSPTRLDAAEDGVDQRSGGGPAEESRRWRRVRASEAEPRPVGLLFASRRAGPDRSPVFVFLRGSRDALCGCRGDQQLRVCLVG
jgi:hypothetical protein